MLTERMKPELMTCHDVAWRQGAIHMLYQEIESFPEDENKGGWRALMAVHAQGGSRNFSGNQ